MKEDKHQDIFFIAVRAMAQFDTLSTPEQIRLLNGLALILPKPEAEAARHTAFMIQKAQEHQAKFIEVLKKKQATPMKQLRLLAT
jgi:hypothetical protein